MGFDWVYVNAFFAPGGSGSIYAIADPFELHPLVRDGEEGDASALIRRFVVCGARPRASGDDRPRAAPCGARSRTWPPRIPTGSIVIRRATWCRRSWPIRPHLTAPSRCSTWPSSISRSRTTGRRSSTISRDLAGHFLKLGIAGLPLQRRLQGPARSLARAHRPAPGRAPGCPLSRRDAGLPLR